MVSDHFPAVGKMVLVVQLSPRVNHFAVVYCVVYACHLFNFLHFLHSRLCVTHRVYLRGLHLFALRVLPFYYPLLIEYPH